MSAAIAIVGMGPRGISAVERIAAAAPTQRLELHVIDDSQIGAGRVWRTDQTPTLCMNTLAGAVTLFTEPGSTVLAPVRIGPTLFEWAQFVRGEKLPEQGDFEGRPMAQLKTELLEVHAPSVPPMFMAEVGAMRPESNPSRALYGQYLNWCYRVAVASLPANISLVEHPKRAVQIEEKDGFDLIKLSDGSQIKAQATLLATGWETPALNPAEQVFADADGLWIAPDNPIDQRIDRIKDGAKVLVRGMGMSFFDLMALLSIDRGGRFVEDTSTRSGLRYEPSGREPHLFVSSGRGYPFLPKSEYGQVPPDAPLTRLRAVIAELDKAPKIDFTAQVWPAIVADAFDEYYRKLAEQRPQALGKDLASVLEVINESSPETIEANLAPLIPQAADRFSLSLWLNPLADVHGSLAEVTEKIAGFMAQDIQESVAAQNSPLKAALWSISCSRRPAELLGCQGRYTWESRRARYSRFMALGTMVGSGPPLFRTRQLLAFVDAGFVTFVGQRPQTRVEGTEFAMYSPTTNTEVRAEVLVDAFLHSPDVRRPADPLTSSLIGRTRPFAEAEAEGTLVATGSPETDAHTRVLIHADGTLDTRLHLVGIPTYAQHADTIISPLPGTDALLLQETGRAVAHALKVALG